MKAKPFKLNTEDEVEAKMIAEKVFDLIQVFSKTNDSKALRGIEKLTTYLFDNNFFEIRDLISLQFLKMEKGFLGKLKFPPKTLYNLNSDILTVYVLFAYTQFFGSVTNLTTEDLLENIDKKSKESDLWLPGYGIFQRAFNAEWLRKSKHILAAAEITEQYKKEFQFLEMIIGIRNQKYLPNKKYTNQMFEEVTMLKFDGRKQYAICQEVLKKNRMDPLKDESFGKMYRKYIKNK